MTVYYYIAKKNPKEAIQLLVSEGYKFKMPQSAKELSDLLKQYVTNEGKDGLEKLSHIHPDKQLISEFTATESFLNASGSGCGCGGKMAFDSSSQKCNCRNCKYHNFDSQDCGCQRVNEKSSICNCGQNFSGGYHSFSGENSSDRTLKFAMGAGVLLVAFGVLYKLIKS
jgi:hypothetical protein